MHLVPIFYCRCFFVASCIHCTVTDRVGFSLSCHDSGCGCKFYTSSCRQTAVLVLLSIFGGITEQGQLFACGEMDNGKLGCDAGADIDHFRPQRVNVSERMTSVSCGHNHTAAVTGRCRLVSLYILHCC